MQQAEKTTQCHVMILDATSTTYTFYNLEITKEKKKESQKTNQRKKRQRKCLPQEMWQDTYKNVADT